VHLQWEYLRGVHARDWAEADREEGDIVLLELISSSTAQRSSWALIQLPDRGRPTFQVWWPPVALRSIKRRWCLGHESRGSRLPPHPTVLAPSRS
jgi:hypothetical protein